MPKRRGNNEIQIARGRLKGILQDLVDLDDENDDGDKNNLPMRGRPPKRLKLNNSENLTSVHESFVMKLFDRGLDLARFQENSALYSVCRAWNLNKPRINIENIMEDQVSQKREKMPELQEKILKNDIGLVSNMPAPKENVEDEFKETKKKTIDEISINSLTISKEDLLKDNKEQWKKVKESWMEKVKARHNKYILSFQLLNAIKEI